MGGKETESDACGDLLDSDGRAVDVKKQNGFEAGSVYNQFPYCNSVQSSVDSLQTYKRRKKNQAHNEKASESLQSDVKEKFNEISHTENAQEIVARITRNASNGSSIKQWRKYFLQQMFTSLDGEKGLKECIGDALVFDSESGCSSAIKESVQSCEDLRKCAASFGLLQNATSGTEEVTCNVSANDTNHHRVTELCQRIFFEVITSEKFARLCYVLKNLGGAKAHTIFDISGIDSRMKDGAYESSPVLFLSDIEELLFNLQRAGSDIVALTKSLLEKSRTAYHEQFLTQEPDMLAKVEHTEANGTYELHTCKCCKEKADVRDSLVCDSCEEMYHVTCVKLKEIPSRSWYCASCTSKGIESLHENCVVCDRQKASRLLANIGVDHQLDSDDLDESSSGFPENDVQLFQGEEMSHCHVCRSDVEGCENIQICGHAFCPHKFYHTRCLTRKQLNSYGPLWYCPSCLCRVCLTDRDDEKIVLCDACDHAYHIYCMRPPRTLIPQGKWYCTKCDSEIRLIRKAKRTYESLQSGFRKPPQQEPSLEGHKSDVDGEGKEPLDNSAAVDMLLKAATTLNNEDNLGGMSAKS